VLQDDDAEKMNRAMEWARAHGKLTEAEASLSANRMSDEEVNRLIAQRDAAKKARDFGRADAVRKQLTEAGITVEDTKDGTRWKRK